MLNAMVAGIILYIFIGTAVLVGSAGPTTSTPSIHFSNCNYFAPGIHQGEVRPYLMAWLYHEIVFSKIGTETKEKRNNYCDETYLNIRKENSLGLTWTGSISPS
jgi:hypothetical protein